jgi:predicted nucleic acid-binding protein
MYLVGAEHPHRSTAAALIQRLVIERKKLVTDAEVYQEILHRYVSIRRPEAIQPAFDLLSGLVDDVYPIDLEVVSAAKSLVLAYQGLSARDGIHIAVMARHHVSQIMSFDDGFDKVPGIERLFLL